MDSARAKRSGVQFQIMGLNLLKPSLWTQNLGFSEPSSRGNRQMPGNRALLCPPWRSQCLAAADVTLNYLEKPGEPTLAAMDRWALPRGWASS